MGLGEGMEGTVLRAIVGLYVLGFFTWVAVIAIGVYVVCVRK